MRPAAQTLTDDSGLEPEDDPEFCEMLRQDPDRATFAGQRKNRLEDPAMLWTLEKDEQLAAGYLLENHFGQKRFGCIRKNSYVTCGLRGLWLSLPLVARLRPPPALHSVQEESAH